MITGFFLTLIIFVLFFSGVAEDFISKKISNWTNLIRLGVSLLIVLLILGFDHWTLRLTSIPLVLGLMLPLFLIRAIGAGDVKLMAALAVFWDWKQVVFILLFSLIWGALFGVISSLLKDRGKTLLKNIYLIAHKHLYFTAHYMPFSFALFLGWVTVLIFGVDFPWL